MFLLTYLAIMSFSFVAAWQTKGGSWREYILPFVVANCIVAPIFFGLGYAFGIPFLEF